LLQCLEKLSGQQPGVLLEDRDGTLEQAMFTFVALEAGKRLNHLRRQFVTAALKIVIRHAVGERAKVGDLYLFGVLYMDVQSK
jgi:hypothetical protein